MVEVSKPLSVSDKLLGEPSQEMRSSADVKLKQGSCKGVGLPSALIPSIDLFSCKVRCPPGFNRYSIAGTTTTVKM